jgi:hypothetical protein
VNFDAKSIFEQNFAEENFSTNNLNVKAAEGKKRIKLDLIGWCCKQKAREKPKKKTENFYLKIRSITDKMFLYTYR